MAENLKKLEDRMIEFVAGCDDAAKLRSIAFNARNSGAEDLLRAAKLKLFAVLPGEKTGTLEYDVWQSIHALEDTLTDERGKTVRLSRTRPKIAREGEVKCASDLIRGAESEGFRMLENRGMLHLSFEAVALRHSDRFTDEVLQAARLRLEEKGFTQVDR